MARNRLDQKADLDSLLVTVQSGDIERAFSLLALMEATLENDRQELERLFARWFKLSNRIRVHGKAAVHAATALRQNPANTVLHRRLQQSIQAVEPWAKEMKDAAQQIAEILSNE